MLRPPRDKPQSLLVLPRKGSHDFADRNYSNILSPSRVLNAIGAIIDKNKSLKTDSITALPIRLETHETRLLLRSCSHFRVVCFFREINCARLVSFPSTTYVEEIPPRIFIRFSSILSRRMSAWMCLWIALSLPTLWSSLLLTLHNHLCSFSCPLSWQGYAKILTSIERYSPPLSSPLPCHPVVPWSRRSSRSSNDRNSLWR